MPKMTPSEAMAEVLVEEGVKHVSGILGSAYMDLLDLRPRASTSSPCVMSRPPATWKTPSAA